VSAEVGGCPSTTSSDVMLQEGDDDELEELDEFSLSSSSDVMLHEKDGELDEFPLSSSSDVMLHEKDGELE